MHLVDKIDFLQMQMPENLAQKIRSQKLGEFSGLLWRSLLPGFSNWLTLAYFAPRKPILSFHLLVLSFDLDLFLI
jgi:hypothetical protein